MSSAGVCKAQESPFCPMKNSVNLSMLCLLQWMSGKGDDVETQNSLS
jgi:hypothetical protein